MKLFTTSLLGLGLAGSSLAASIVTYSSRASFLGDVSTPTTFDFNSSDRAIWSLGGTADLFTVGGDNNAYIHSGLLWGSLNGQFDAFEPIKFSFSHPDRAFGFDNLDFTVDEEAVVVANFANGDSAQTFVFNLGGEPAFTPTFFGLKSDTDLSSVLVYSRTPGTTVVGERANILDNVTVDAVPEPATMAILGLGVVGLLKRRTK